MTQEKEIMIEIAKNKSDAIIVKKEIEVAKNQFIDDILNGGLGEEIYNHADDVIIKKTIKIGFWTKVKDKITKILKTIGL